MYAVCSSVVFITCETMTLRRTEMCTILLLWLLLLKLFKQDKKYRIQRDDVDERASTFLRYIWSHLTTSPWPSTFWFHFSQNCTAIHNTANSIQTITIECCTTRKWRTQHRYLTKTGLVVMSAWVLYLTIKQTGKDTDFWRDSAW